MFKIGQVLKGRVGSYTITSQLQESVWLAVNKPIEQNVIVKYTSHFRTRNERDMLLKFQSRTPHLRPLIDEVELEEGCKWPALVLKHLDDDLLRAANREQKSTRAEMKRVGKSILQGLQVLHEDGFVHTDIKPSNILVNYNPTNEHITDVQLADLEETSHVDSNHAKDGIQIGTPMFRSTEAILQMRWGTPTDIWSYGVLMINLLYGGDFFIFRPDVPVDHEEYDLKILMRHHQCFGPFPFSYEEIADEETIALCTWIMNNTPAEATKPFFRTSSREISAEDRDFIVKIMKIDPRDRPTAQQLLEDDWFSKP